MTKTSSPRKGATAGAPLPEEELWKRLGPILDYAETLPPRNEDGTLAAIEDIQHAS